MTPEEARKPPHQRSTAMTVIELSDYDGTEFDAGDLGTAWLPYSEPRAQDLEQLAIALIQHAKDMQ